MKYIPFIPVGILMTVFGAKLSLASPISRVWVSEYLLIFEFVESALLFSSMCIFFFIDTYTNLHNKILSSLLLCGFFLSLLFVNYSWLLFLCVFFYFFFISFCFNNVRVKEYEQFVLRSSNSSKHKSHTHSIQNLYLYAKTFRFFWLDFLLYYYFVKINRRKKRTAFILKSQFFLAFILCFFVLNFIDTSYTHICTSHEF